MATSAISASLLRDLNTVVNDKFVEGMARAKDSSFSQLVMTISGVGETVSLPYLAYFPQVSEMFDKPIIKNVIDSVYQIRNKEYEATVAIKTIDVERRNTPLYAPLMSAAGRRAAMAPTYIALDLLTKLAFDATARDFTGTAFFATDKPFFAFPAGYKGDKKSLKWSNKGTDKLSFAALSAAIANIQNRTDMDGKPLFLGQGDFILAVAPERVAYAESIVKQRSFYATQEAALFQNVKVLGVPTMAADTWMLFDVSDDFKPIVWNSEIPFNIFNTAQNPNDSDVIQNRRFLYQIYGSGGIGWGSSLLAYGSLGSSGSYDNTPSQA